MATRSKSSANNDGPDTASAPQNPTDEPRQARKREPRKDPQDAAIPEEQLRAMIEHEAYLRYERRGFEPGHEVEDWLAAEADIRRMLRDGPREKH